MSAVDLSAVSIEDLKNELRSRSMVLSIWAQEDVVSLIEEDEACADFTEEQVEQAAILALDEMGRDLEEHLGSKGNEFTSDRWAVIREQIIAQVRGAAPAV